MCASTLPPVPCVCVVCKRIERSSDPDGENGKAHRNRGRKKSRTRWSSLGALPMAVNGPYIELPRVQRLRKRHPSVSSTGGLPGGAVGPSSVVNGEEWAIRPLCVLGVFAPVQDRSVDECCLHRDSE